MTVGKLMELLSGKNALMGEPRQWRLHYGTAFGGDDVRKENFFNKILKKSLGKICKPKPCKFWL